MSFMKIASLFTPKKDKRRGVAIELALAVMFVSLALSALIVSTAVIGAKQVNRIRNDIKAELALDEIGESFCSAVKNGDDLDEWCASLEGYTAEYEKVGTDSISLSVFDGEGNTVLALSLEASSNGTGYVIKKWTHQP